MSSTDFHFYIGFALAVSSTIFIGCSFIIKKVALRRLAATGIRAGELIVLGFFNSFLLVFHESIDYFFIYIVETHSLFFCALFNSFSLLSTPNRCFMT